MKIRFAMLAAACLFSGCAATKQEVSENLGSRFIGKNVDSLVTEFGPPASAFRMNSGETA
jgi:PBP1b-binding outer membrane lipoprotein LpoB